VVPADPAFWTPLLEYLIKSNFFLKVMSQPVVIGSQFVKLIHHYLEVPLCALQALLHWTQGFGQGRELTVELILVFFYMCFRTVMKRLNGVSLRPKVRLLLLSTSLGQRSVVHISTGFVLYYVKIS
jgi:hypothetical protein